MASATIGAPLPLAQTDVPASGALALGAKRVLQVPLPVKLIGANLSVLVCSVVAAVMLVRANASPAAMLEALAAALVLGTVVNIALTWLALRPVRDMQKTVSRIRRGYSRVRIEPSVIGDSDLNSLGATVNALLDHLEDDRVQMQKLTTNLIQAEDRERARVSHELHESIAQSVAGLTYQLAVLIQESSDAPLVSKLEEMRGVARQVLDEVDALSHSIHPRVLRDLGLLAGLRRLASELSTPRLSVQARLIEGDESTLRQLTPDAESALYAIVQAAVDNAAVHARANRVKIELRASPMSIDARVIDDGVGFDVANVEMRRAAPGLYKMRKRASMVGGELHVTTDRGHGTTVQVIVPLDPPPLTSE